MDISVVRSFALKGDAPSGDQGRVLQRAESHELGDAEPICEYGWVWISQPFVSAYLEKISANRIIPNRDSNRTEIP